MRNLLKCSGQQFRLCITGDLTETLVHQKARTIDRDLRDADCGLLKRGTETFFCFAKHLFGVYPLGNVFHEKENATDISSRVEPRADFPFGPTNGTIGPVEPV